MRTCLALLSFLVLLASPFFFAYLGAECLFVRPDAVYRWSDPWVPLVMIVYSCVITLAVPWIVGLSNNSDDRDGF